MKSKKNRIILIVVIALVLILGSIFAINYWNNHKIYTVQQVLSLNLDSVDRIDISNGDTPQTKITNKTDIQNILNPYLQVKMHKTSDLSNLLDHTTGAFGLYFVIYKNGVPYMHMQIFQPNMIVIHEENKSKTFYHTVNSLDANTINQLIKKYKLGK